VLAVRANRTTLASLDDVAGTFADGEVPVYNSATGKFEPGEGGGGLAPESPTLNYGDPLVGTTVFSEAGAEEQNYDTSWLAHWEQEIADVTGRDESGIWHRVIVNNTGHSGKDIYGHRYEFRAEGTGAAREIHAQDIRLVNVGSGAVRALVPAKWWVENYGPTTDLHGLSLDIINRAGGVAPFQRMVTSSLYNLGTSTVQEGWTVVNVVDGDGEATQHVIGFSAYYGTDYFYDWQFDPSSPTGATTPLAIGYQIWPACYDGTSITDLYGIRMEPIAFSGAGVITNWYGMRLPNMAGRATGINRPIWCEGGASLFQAGAAGVVPLTLRGAASQTANLIEWQDSASAVVASVGANGALYRARAFTGGVVALVDAATIATNAALGNHFRVSTASDRTLGAPTNPADGQFCSWRITNTDASSRTLTLASGAGGFRFCSTITGLSAIAAGKADIIGAIYHQSDNRWEVVSYSKGHG
jgi:hypothetical protein